MKIGLIGFGRFGKLISKYLKDDFSILVHDISDINTDCYPGIQFYTNLKEMHECQALIVCVPISKFKTCIKNLSNIVQSHQVVIDICSVKTFTMNIMQDFLPNNISYLGLHPMFGPDSASLSLNQKDIVWCGGRLSEECERKIQSYFKSKNLKTVHLSAQEHDKQIAKTQVLTHYIGRGLMQTDARQFDISTEGYNRLLHILDVVKNDTKQLFEDMNTYNPYAKKVREQFLKSIQTVNESLNQS